MAPLSIPPSDGQLKNLIDELSKLPIYSIGRKADNKIVIQNGKISGQHAQLIQCSATSFIIEDLDSKNGTFCNGVRIKRKVVDATDVIRLADCDYTADQLLSLIGSNRETPSPVQEKQVIPVVKATENKTQLDFTTQFADLQQVYDQYPKLRKDCRNREKMIRTGSIILSSIVGISAVFTTGGAALPLLHVMSGAGLSMLIPTLCSTILSTDEKLEVIDKEYRDRYRCPNSTCRDPFGTREWELLAQQKTCRRCQAVWVK